MNLHQRHIEDLILYEGKAGLEKIKQSLKNPDHVSLKIDGSPSFFLGRNKEGDLFVSTKSIANKTPKVYRSKTEMSEIKSEDLRHKLSEILKFYHDTEINGILQGDMLFSEDSTFMLLFPNKKYLAFHPNTLIYGMKFHKHYKLGVAFHTQYDDDMNNMRPYDNHISFNGDIYQAYLPINYTDFEIELEEHPDIDISHRGRDLEKYFNKLIRAGHRNIVHHEHTTNIAEELNIPHKDDLHQILKFVYNVSVVKKKLINSLNDYTSLNVWYKNDDGLHETNHEGFVISFGGAAYKLVDREVFSYLNFSPDILKGWNEPTRK